MTTSMLAPPWRVLAETVYATSRFGRTEEFPPGTVLRRVAGSYAGCEPFPDVVRVVAAKGSPFECEETTVVRPDGTHAHRAVPALWWASASALRFES